jgi:hypothetical protein
MRNAKARKDLVSVAVGGHGDGIKTLWGMVSMQMGPLPSDLFAGFECAARPDDYRLTGWLGVIAPGKGWLHGWT